MYIESSEFNIHHDIMNRCQAAGVTPHIAFESSGFSLCQKMVTQNKGISVIVDFISDDMYNSNLVLLPFSDGPYYWETYMLTRRGEAPNPDVLLFRDFIMEWMRKINTRMKNLPNPKYLSSGGNDTVDKIFLLSMEQLESYLPQSKDRALGHWWWVRTPGLNTLSAVSVYEDGTIYAPGINVHFAEGGIRPALWMRLKKETV